MLIKANFPRVLREGGFDPKKEYDKYLVLQEGVINSLVSLVEAMKKNKKPKPPKRPY